MAEQKTAEKKSFGQVISDSINELKETFVAFVKAPRALWGVNIPYVMEGLVYFGILTILGKYCSENVALSDLHAGWVYGFVTGGITFAMLIFGGVTDKIGVRRSLAIALSLMMVGRFMVALSGVLPLGSGVGSPMFFLMIFGLFIAVAAYGLYQPAAYAGVKRYTTPKTAAIAYAVVYGLMNLGAFFSGFISSNTRHLFENVFPPNGLPAVFWVFTFLTFSAVIATLFILNKKTDEKAVKRVAEETAAMAEEADEKQEEKKEEKPAEKIKYNNGLFITMIVVAVLGAIGWAYTFVNDIQMWVKPALGLVAILALAFGVWDFLRQRPDHPFRDIRFVFFIFALVPVQTLFAHNWLTLPYYLDRAFAGTFVGEYFEVFSNLNPILIFFMAPVIAALTASANVYRMMIWGTLIMAIPTFLLALGPNTYLFLTYIFFMTLGEAMWQPRFLQWIAEIAPEGKTGAYMGIGQLPWFLTKMVTATYSGYFVANYVPKPDQGMEMRTGEMWLLYAIIAMVSPVLLILAKKWMAKGMKEKAA